MIISFFKRGQSGVQGTINTNAGAPEATGVGETLLSAFMSWNKEEGENAGSLVNQLESYFSSWGNQEGEAAVLPSGETPGQFVLVVDGDKLALTQRSPGVLNVRADKKWVKVSENEEKTFLRGRQYRVVNDILTPWDNGDIQSTADIKTYAQRSTATSGGVQASALPNPWRIVVNN